MPGRASAGAGIEHGVGRRSATGPRFACGTAAAEAGARNSIRPDRFGLPPGRICWQHGGIVASMRLFGELGRAPAWPLQQAMPLLAQHKGPASKALGRTTIHAARMAATTNFTRTWNPYLDMIRR